MKSRVIRVDSEVFAALQARARPLIDTPNDVLRKLLKLEKKQKGMRMPNRSNRSDSGRQINKRYNLGARHALYHVDGTFYERLNTFPGILADSRGYVWFQDEDSFLNDANVDVQEKVHVPATLAHHPRYTRFPTP